MGMQSRAKSERQRAIEPYQTHLTLIQNAFGKIHPRSAWAHAEMAALFDELNEWTKAVYHWRCCLDIQHDLYV
jgi:hypothetical protein